MKQLFSLMLVVFLFGCNGIFDDTIHYSGPVTQSKEYPVYFDMSEIGNIQVIANSPITAPFKILSNTRYYFVGEQLKGIHVYEKQEQVVNYLCFIECNTITDFEVAENRLFCNNLLDLVVLDVSNPMQITILHRQKNHFNRFTGYKEYWNIPYVEGKGLIAGTQIQQLSGIITDRKPDLDFSELDQLNDHLTTKVMPDTWFSRQTVNDRPYPGMVKMGMDEIYTYGSYNSWAICTYREGAFSVKEEDLWTEPRGKYAPPYYYSGAYPVRIFYEDSVIFILGTLTSLMSGYADCILYDEKYPLTHQLYFPTFRPLDICYMPALNAFFTLSGTSVWGVFISGDGVSGYKKTFKDFGVATDAVEMIRVDDKLLCLGSELSLYAVSENELSLLKRYPEISGKCFKKEGNVLAVANTQGLMVYDISDVEDIKK